MSWEDSIPKKALRCIRKEVNIILSEVELNENLVGKLEEELLRYVEMNADRYVGKYPKVPTRYLAGTLAEDADYIEEYHVKPLKKYLEKLNHIEDNYSDSSEIFYPDFKENIDNISDKFTYMKALAYGLRALSTSLEGIAGKF